ncbi:Asp/Glu racemase [Hoeflea sp. WL0058]|uniref:Asp/Glu racemase n=1 Tax=Flavimaribacter sediminis TaxID=2865987 RepID=A0AAE2ZIF9_9HYPH|nr:aspartate/glutamate racemase family protein [Flavimaribacter sediminis]MBW8636554.1 Asp/Glu racemase [Flavimaribacter sediminis]
MLKFHYDLDPERDRLATYGIIVLKTDETLEKEFGVLLDRASVVHYSRIESEALVTPETLRLMEARIPQSTAMLPEGANYNAVAYGCTSGATTIGAQKVADAVNSVIPDVPVTDPITATIARLRSIDARKICLLTPYIPSVTDAMAAKLTGEGFEIVASGSFYEERESAVVRISQASVLAAVEALAQQADADAVFVSCTNLPTIDILEEARKRTGSDVFSSNSALAWHLQTIARRSQ